MVDMGKIWKKVIAFLKPTDVSLKTDRRIQFVKTVLITFISLAIFIGVWWELSLLIDTAFLPTPDIVFEAFIDSFGNPDITTGRTMWDNIITSSIRVAWGFLLAFVLAVPLGLMMGFSKTFESFSKPVVEVFRPIAPIAWAPLLIIALGGIVGPIIVIFIGVFFPLLSNIIFGVRSIQPILMDAAKTLGARRRDMFIKVIIPSTVPYIMTGIRIGLGIGWMCVVAAEFLGAVGGGVGQYVQFKTEVNRFDQVFAGLIVFAILGLSTTELSGWVERRVSRRMGLK